jgi:hypothetical protein
MSCDLGEDEVAGFSGRFMEVSNHVLAVFFSQTQETAP